MSSPVLGTPSSGAATGHARVHMPNVVGLTRAQVYAAMRAAQLFFRTQGPGSGGNWVSVSAEAPAPGTLVPWHSTVTLTTSLNPVHVAHRMPDVVGLTRARVYAAMRAAQLFFRTQGPGSSDDRWVSVTRQSPPAGTLVPWHSTVTLTTSLAVPHAKRRVPRLVGLTRVRAVSLAHSSALVLRPVGPGASTNTWTRVLRQSPAPGALVAWHSVVTIAVAGPVTRPTTTTSTTTTSTVPPTTTTTYPGETTTTTLAPPTTTIPTTTTTVRVTTTTVHKPSKAKDFRIGVATWYNYVPGHCATWFLPYGTRIVVRDLATGRAIRCVVTDREAARGDRVVDLSETQFAQLAPLTKGVILVKVSW